VAEFGNIDALRHYLIATLQKHRGEAQRGIIADFSPTRYDEQSMFVRIGKGSLGGKGRGLGFASAMLQRFDLAREFPGVQISVPRSAVVCTDLFEEFLATNDLHELAYHTDDDEKIHRAFADARLPETLVAHLRTFLAEVRVPIAVRSSSLLEDSQAQPFAGIYRTYMLSNSHPKDVERLRQLCSAIQMVYASCFTRASKGYIESTPYRIEDEKMAVILQEIVGSKHEESFYPEASGVARSYNYYPVEPMQPEEGLAVMALGLGRQVVGGRQSLRFSPAHPQNIPEFSDVEATRNQAQRDFYALDLSKSDLLPDDDEGANLVQLELADALRHGTLDRIASSYSAANHVIYDGLSRGEHPVLTFAPLLKSQKPPLPKILERLLAIGAEGMGGAVEMEFALNLSQQPATFGFLQIRRLIEGGEPEDVHIDADATASAVCHSERALGNGLTESARDIIYVRPNHFERSKSPQIAAEVGRLNKKLKNERRPYVLIGPGRWGSSDPWLGIPVRWDQINAARVIVEAALEDFRVEPSQGTHFFQNMTSLGIGYFTVNSFAGSGHVDWKWLAEQEIIEQSDYLIHVRLEDPVRVRIDGRHGRGVILRPEVIAPIEDET
jgi:hypothetical protein